MCVKYKHGTNTALAKFKSLRDTVDYSSVQQPRQHVLMGIHSQVESSIMKLLAFSWIMVVEQIEEAWERVGHVNVSQVWEGARKNKRRW